MPIRYLSLSSAFVRHYSSQLQLQAPIGDDNIVSSPFLSVPYPKISLYKQVFKDFAKYGSRIAFVDGVTAKEYSYNEIAESTTKFSSALSRMGFKKNDVLSICAPNCLEYAVAFFGAVASGGIVSTVNPTYMSDELAYQFENSGTKILATVPSILPTVQKAAEKAGVEKIVVFGSKDDIGTSDSKLVAYHNLLEDTGSRFDAVSVDAMSDIAILPYSSGTSGIPKGVMLTHHNVISNILQLEDKRLFYLYEDNTTLLGVLPFFHIYGMVVILFSSLHAGSKIVSLPKFEPELFLSAMEKYKTNIVNLVPPLLLFLAKHPLVEKYDLSCIDQIMAGAAPLGGNIVHSVKERLNCRLVRQGYGLTETSPVTHVLPDTFGLSKAQSVGVPLRSIDVKIMDIEKQEALPANKEGELWIRGPNIMKGYLNLPEVTKSCIVDNGWFRTGDIGYFDSDGCFYITDRLKELIKVKGFQVAPAELEALLQSHDKISDAAVIGVPDERLGEAPKAFVVKKDAALQEKDVEKFVGSQVAAHKHLAGGVEFIEAIPKSASGKILRRLLKEK